MPACWTTPRLPLRPAIRSSRTARRAHARYAERAGGPARAARNSARLRPQRRALAHALGTLWGTRALPAVYDLYFQRFRQVFFDDLSGSISGTLLRLPPSPDPQNSYNGTYDRLKSYRMITQGKCHPTRPSWRRCWTISGSPAARFDPDRQVLAVKQINFYAAELKQKNPYKVEENKDAIDRGRIYLSAFGGVERLYRGIIEEANKKARVARLADLAPNL